MPCLNRSQLVIVFLTFVSTLKQVDTAIVVSPEDVDAMLGTSVAFNCSSSIPGANIQWSIYPVGKGAQVIYAFGKVNAQYAGRFKVQDGDNLHVSSITLDDAGTYQCQDDFGHGEKRNAELIVIETNPICQSASNLNRILGNNTLGIEPCQVTLSCSVQYQGNKAPTMEWKKIGENKTITSRVNNEIRGNRVLHNLTMKGDLIANGSSYSCRPTKAATATSCNSGKITIVDNTAWQSESCKGYIAAIISICAIVCLGITSIILFIKVWKKTIIGKEKEEGKNLLSKKKDQEITDMKKTIDKLEAELKKKEAIDKLTVAKDIEQLRATVKDFESHLFPTENIYYYKEPRFLQTINLNNEKIEIKGLAVLENELFVVRENISEMEIYSLDTCKLKHNFSIEGIQAPFDLTCWQQGKADKCLFIIGFPKGDETDDVNEEENQCLNTYSEGKKDTSIVRIDVSTKSLQTKWSKPSGGGKGRLSTFKSKSSADNSRLVVLFSGANIIKEFKLDGDVIHIVNLSKLGIMNKLHAVKVTSMHFALSSKDGEDGYCRIFVIDIEANIIKEYREKGESIPHQFLIDGDGSFLVADRGQHCVLLFMSSLSRNRKLIELKQGEKPKRICFDKTRTELLVGIEKWENNRLVTARVAVYAIKESKTQISNAAHPQISKYVTDLKKEKNVTINLQQ